MITFRIKDVQPPSLVYTPPYATLRLDVYNSEPNIIIHLDARSIDAKGKPQVHHQTIVPTSDRVLSTVAIVIGEGYLVSARISLNTGAPLRGQTWCLLELRATTATSSPILQTFISDYLVSKSALTYPGGRIISSVEGPGRIYNPTVANPAPGAEWTFVVPTNTLVKLLGIQVRLDTDANVAARTYNLFIAPNGDAIYRIPSPVTQAANLIYFYNFTPDAPAAALYTAPSVNSVTQSMGHIWLPPGSAFISGTTNIQATDQYSEITPQFEEWIAP